MYDRFDTILKGLGKPYCVIRSQRETLYDNPEEYIFNDIYVIYKNNDAFLVLECCDNANESNERVEVSYVDWIASEDMLREYIKDDFGSNLEHTHTYLFQNGKDLIDVNNSKNNEDY